MKSDDLGNRMKNYESCFDYRLPPRMAMIVRIDGKSFHSMTRKWKCVKPYINMKLGISVNRIDKIISVIGNQEYREKVLAGQLSISNAYDSIHGKCRKSSNNFQIHA